jgi:hypothetical protein
VEVKLLLFRRVASFRQGEPAVLARKIWPKGQMCSDQMAHKNLAWSISIADCGLRIGDFGLGISDWGMRIADFGRRIVDCGLAGDPGKKGHLVPEEQDAHDRQVITN